MYMYFKLNFEKEMYFSKDCLYNSSKCVYTFFGTFVLEVNLIIRLGLSTGESVGTNITLTAAFLYLIYPEF